MSNPTPFQRSSRLFAICVFALGAATILAQEPALPAPAAAGPDVPLVVSGSSTDTANISSLLGPTSPVGGSGGAGLMGLMDVGPVNLLGLGRGSTLTLINGRRLMNLPALNAIPLAAIGRVEVSKPGTSIANGSDALGGTFNYVLLDGPGTLKYSGSEIDLFYGTTGKGGSAQGTSFTTGYTSDKLSLAFGASYYQQNGTALNSARYSPYANGSLQNTSYFGAVDYKLIGRAMQVYGDVLVSDTKADGVFRPSSRSSRVAGFSAVDPTDPGISSRYYRATVGLRGQLPNTGTVLSGINYDVGMSYDEGRQTGFDSTDPRATSLRRTH